MVFYVRINLALGVGMKQGCFHDTTFLLHLFRTDVPFMLCALFLTDFEDLGEIDKLVVDVVGEIDFDD